MIEKTRPVMSRQDQEPGASASTKHGLPSPSVPIGQLQKTLEREIASLRRQRRRLDCPQGAVLLFGPEELRIDRQIELKSQLLLTLKNLAQNASGVATGNMRENSPKTPRDVRCLAVSC
jgi:hypothetical protein